MIEPMPHEALPPLPPAGRVFSGHRRVRFGDVGPDGLLRLDAAATYLQDVSSDDTSDAGLGDDPGWVVRRSVIHMLRPARWREEVRMKTFCSGTGSRWAERRISLEGDAGARMEASVLWVRIDPVTGRPAPLGEDFLSVYGPSAGGRQPSTKLTHAASAPAGAREVAWKPRHADMDPLGHVNNAAAWQVVEEVLAVLPDLAAPFRAELEHRAPLSRDELVLSWVDGDAGLDLWLSVPGTTTAALTGRVRSLAD